MAYAVVANIICLVYKVHSTERVSKYLRSEQHQLAMNLGTSHSSIRKRITCSTPMNGTIFERPQEPRRWNGAAYTCADGVKFSYEYKVCKVGKETTRKMDLRGTITAPRNGILLKSGKPPVVVVNKALMSRSMKKIIHGGQSKMYAFPSSIIIVGNNAFSGNEVVSVKFNEGLKALEKNCFESSGIRKLVLPASVESIGDSAFDMCGDLESADLSAARGLKCIGNFAFNLCMTLK